jgi:hypothetical protein
MIPEKLLEIMIFLDIHCQRFQIQLGVPTRSKSAMGVHGFLGLADNQAINL